MASFVLGKMTTIPGHIKATYITLMVLSKTIMNSSLVSTQLEDVGIHFVADSTLGGPPGLRGTAYTLGGGRRGGGRRSRRVGGRWRLISGRMWLTKEGIKEYGRLSTGETNNI